MILDKNKIREIQINLNKVINTGVLKIKPLTVDGLMGNSTKEAITLFQFLAELNPDGIYGTNTDRALIKYLNDNNLQMSDKTTLSLEDFKSKKNNKQILIYHALDSGMTNKNELAMLLAQLDHESMGFTRLEENLNYKPATLLRVFPKYVKDINDATKLVASGPQAIANRIYGGRMGNDTINDGWFYRGRTFIQLTGEDNYVLHAKLTGLDIVNNPNLAINADNASIISLSYWNNKKGLADAAKQGDVNRCTYLINGGYNGLDERKRLFAKYLAEV